jgi:hypothetical protein
MTHKLRCQHKLRSSPSAWTTASGIKPPWALLEAQALMDKNAALKDEVEVKTSRPSPNPQLYRAERVDATGEMIVRPSYLVI